MLNQTPIGAISTADLSCPHCHEHLRTHGDRLLCLGCHQTFPVVLGIPDLRLEPDPYIGVDDDYAKAARLVDDQTASFVELNERYWKITPDVPPTLAQRYIRHVLASVRRGQSCLASIDQQAGALHRPAPTGGAFLEIGCGTGGFLIAAAQRGFDPVIGVDIAFRWVALAHRRVADAVRQGELTAAQAARIQILCAGGDALPLGNQRFAVIVASNVLEHTRRQEALIAEARRVLQPAGLVYLATVNRFSLTPEPHVQLLGVGFLPPAWRPAYVRRLKGLPYRHVHLRSLGEVAALLGRHGFAQWRFNLPSLGATERAAYRGLEGFALDCYAHLARLPLARTALLHLGPLFTVIATTAPPEAP